MSNKCPKCGFELEEFDIFCARCGQKIIQNIKTNNNSNIKKENETLNDSMDSFVNDFNKKKMEYFNSSNAKSVFDNPLITYLVFIIILCIAFALSLNIFLSKQHENKLKLQYKNMISRPQLIPELKEPESYFELAENIKKVESFLSLYLKYSTDTQEKKEKIFANYLDELNKVSHITNEYMVDEKLNQCSAANSLAQARSCTKKLNKLFKDTSIIAYNDKNTVYLYPNNHYIKKHYSKYLSSKFKDYLKLKEKYSTPTSIGLSLKIPPKKLADRIYSWEKFLNSTDDAYIKENVQFILYNDFRKFIFSPSIYSTPTKEMKKSFRSAYNYFLRTKRKSNLAPVVMSYLDKQKNYSEENFKKDYPYQTFEKTYEEMIKQSTLQDVFMQLRNNIFTKNSKAQFKFVFNTVTNKWSTYSKDATLKPVEYVLCEIDENNTISIYNSTIALFQELNIPKYSKLLLVNSKLYIFNQDRLIISKVNFNSENFNITQLSANDVTSIFPGVNVINIDNYSNYNIYLEKDNAQESFIILSRYSQGWSKYSLESIKGNIQGTILPNMFVVNSLNDVEIAYRADDNENSETSELTPTYKFTIHTKGQTKQVEEDENSIIQYDEKTNRQESDTETYKPIIKPKINDKNEEDEEDELFTTPPTQRLEAPEEE